MRSPATRDEAGSDLDRAPAVTTVPFTRASYRKREGMYDSGPILLTGAFRTIGPIEIPSNGYLRGVWIEIAPSVAGVAGTPHADFPFSLIGEAVLQDTNNNQIIYPINGYELACINKFGGYQGLSPDPRFDPDYDSTATTPCFRVWLPVEVSEDDGFGALPNGNATTPYRITLRLSGGAGAYSVAPTTQPTVTVRAWMETWAPTLPSDSQGNVQASRPPAAGATQQWSSQTFNNVNGTQTLKLSRVGGVIRTIIIINRSAATGLRGVSGRTVNPPGSVTTFFPATLNFLLDGENRRTIDRGLWRAEMYRRYGYGFLAGASPTFDDVYVMTFADDGDGIPGNEGRKFLLATNIATRAEFQGTWGGASNVTILTNDVYPPTT